MLQPSLRREHQGAGATDRGIIIALHPGAARTGRDVQDHVVILRANEPHHLAIIVQRLRWIAGFAVSHMQMDDRRASLRRGQRFGRDMIGPEREIGMIGHG